jgi:hypothetical protein
VAFQFEPLAPDVSYNILDGEALVNGTVQAHMLPGGVQFFCGLESVSEVAASAEVNMTTRGRDDRGGERLFWSFIFFHHLATSMKIWQAWFVL